MEESCPQQSRTFRGRAWGAGSRCLHGGLSSHRARLSLPGGLASVQGRHWKGAAASTPGRTGRKAAAQPVGGVLAGSFGGPAVLSCCVSPQVNYWHSDQCNMINGTSGQMWAPFMTPEYSLEFYSPEACR